MHVEVTRLLTAWFEDDTYGVNALLAELPRLNIDGTVDDLPASVDIYNDVDFDEIASVGGINPPSTPSIVVVVDSAPKTTDITKPNKPAHVTQGGLVAGIGYFAPEGYRHTEIVAGGYVLRAVKQSLTQYNKLAQRKAKKYRLLNEFELVRIESVEWQRVAGGVPGSTLVGFVFADLTVKDGLP